MSFLNLWLRKAVGDVMRMTLFLLLVALVGLFVESRAAADERPNIVFAFADDWGRHASAYAEIDGPGTENDVIQTPNFDALAKSGVLFRNAFVNAPVLYSLSQFDTCRSAFLENEYGGDSSRRCLG